MRKEQLKAIQQEAEELYPFVVHSEKAIAAESALINAENYYIERHRQNFISGATFGLSLNEKRMAELNKELLKSKERPGDFRMNAPNGIRAYLETFYKVAAYIERELMRYIERELIKGVITKTPERIKQAFGRDGSVGIYNLAIELTNEFEELNKNREWDGEFFDEINNFLNEQLSPVFKIKSHE